MSTQTADYFDAATHLPPGGRLTLHDVSWAQYEQLLAQLGDQARFRVSYDRGRLEIMSPSVKHEKLKNLLHDLVILICDEQERNILSFGSVTLKLQPRDKGVEADDCFYIQHASAVSGKDRLDLANDPPPDLVIEVDLTHESSGKFAIYAALGVPEIWHFDAANLQILGLADQIYVAASHSLSFPFLSAEQILQFVAKSEDQGPYQARHDLRARVRRIKPTL